MVVVVAAAAAAVVLGSGPPTSLGARLILQMRSCYFHFLCWRFLHSRTRILACACWGRSLFASVSF